LRAGIGTEEVESTLNRINQELLNKLDESGEVFLSNAIIDGRYALRVCIVNFRTSLRDIEAIPELVASFGRQCATSSSQADARAPRPGVSRIDRASRLKRQREPLP
jgi:hypothetical protein